MRIQDHTSTFKHPLQARSTFCLVLAGGSQIPPWNRSLRDRWTATWASLSLAWKIELLNDHNDTLFLYIFFFPNVNDASHQDPSGSVVRRGTNLFWYWYCYWILLVPLTYLHLFTWYCWFNRMSLAFEFCVLPVLPFHVVVKATSWKPCVHPSLACGGSSSGSRQPDLYDGDDSVDGFLAVEENASTLDVKKRAIHTIYTVRVLSP